jgi:hypothetical protein
VLVRAWDKLTPGQQNSVVGYCWSLMFCTSILLFLAAITITAQHLESAAFELGAADTGAAELSPSISDEFDLESVDDVILEEPSAEMLSLSETLGEAHSVSIDSDGEIGIGTNGSGTSLSSDDQGLVMDTNRRVAQAGGNLKGPIRISLAFSGDDDIDLHVGYEYTTKVRQKKGRSYQNAEEFMSYHVYYGFKDTPHANLDVDANATTLMREPCENIVFRKKPPNGKYIIALDNFKEREEPDDTSYVVVVKYGNNTQVLRGNLGPEERMKEILRFDY